MKFVDNIDKKTYDDFVDNHKLSTFMQCFDWGKFKSIHEWEMYTVGVSQNDKIVASTLLLRRKLPGMNKYIFYAPRGLLVDYRNKELFEFFIKNLRVFCIKNKGVFLRFDPILKKQKHNLEGDVIEGENSLDIINQLKQKGFAYKGSSTNFEGFQPRFVMHLDISEDIDSIFKNFHKKTQYNIKLASRRGIEVREGKKEDLEEFYRIMKITGERDGFRTRQIKYFEEMYDYLVDNDRMKLFIARYNPKKLLNELLNKQKDLSKQLDRVIKKLEDLEDGQLKDKNIKKKEKLEEDLNKLKHQIEKTKEDTNKYKDGVVVSGTIAMRTNRSVCYLYGASDNNYRNYMPNYLIQWEMIKWAKERNAEIYDFRGISGKIDENDHLFGLYRFKKGFNPEFVEYVGEFDLIFNKLLYFVFEKGVPILKKCRKIIKK